MENQNPVKWLKRVVIKQELLELTGNIYKAIILNQLIYWMQRREDFDQYVDELASINPDEDAPKLPKTFGWIYKASSQLASEIMVLKEGKTQIHLKELVERGLVDAQVANENRWDQTKSYRPNIPAIQRELWKLGYHLDGTGIPQGVMDGLRSHSSRESECIPSTGGNGYHRPDGIDTSRQMASKPSTGGVLSTEITSEITTKTTSEDTRSSFAGPESTPPETSTKDEKASHKEFMDRWHNEFLDRFKMKYRFAGGADGAAVKKLMKHGFSVDEIVATARRAWKSDKTLGKYLHQQSLTIKGFASEINAIRVQLSKSRPESGQRQENLELPQLDWDK